MQQNSDLSGVKICLVFPPYKESEDALFLKTMKNGLGKIPPLSLCAVAADIENYGADVLLVDANAEELTLAETIERIAAFKPDFLGFTLSTYQFHFTLQWIKALRHANNIPVIVGGPHARIYPREILSHEDIDFCVLADAEISFAALIHTYLQKGDLREVSGIAFRDVDTHDVVVTDHMLFYQNLDAVPFPSRHLLNNSLYYSLISRHKNFTAMSTSRGCSFLCTFCDNHFIPYRAMNASRIVDEMEACYKEFSIREIDMFDGIFSMTKENLLQVCSELQRRKLKIAWSFRTRIDCIDNDVLNALKRAGCIRIYYGIESASPQILRNIKKNISLEHVAYAVRQTKKSGIETFGFFMVGNDGETGETIRMTEDMIHRLPFDYVQIASIFYPPNTEVYKKVCEMVGFDYWREKTIHPDFNATLPIVGTKFTLPEIHSIVRDLYLRFYLKPHVILASILKMRSIGECVRGMTALYGMLREDKR